jgi:arsenite methyltransferase
MSGLTFTDEAAKQLEKTYRSKDLVAQRSYIIRQLNLTRGERVLDIGCGLQRGFHIRSRIEQADASFDVSVCMQVAEYVPDVDRVLAEAFRVLKPGGRTLFVATDWDAVV